MGNSLLLSNVFSLSGMNNSILLSFPRVHSDPSGDPFGGRGPAAPLQVRRHHQLQGLLRRLRRAGRHGKLRLRRGGQEIENNLSTTNEIKYSRF